MQGRMLKWSAVVVSLAVVLWAVSARAGNAGGSVAGTVTKGGQPVVNAKVLVFHARARQAGAAAGKAARSGGTSSTQKSKPTPLMTVTTDGNGQFTLSNLPAGEYLIVAGEKGEGRGHQRVSVTVGQSTSVTITLTPHAARAKAKGSNGNT